MAQICTNIDQSKRLLELGLHPDTADMYILNSVGESRKVDGTNIHFILKDDLNPMAMIPEIIPSWSLGELLDIMPDSIQDQLIDIRKSLYYQIGYGCWTNDGSWSDMINTPHCDSLVDAAYSMVVWLLENNHINSEES